MTQLYVAYKRFSQFEGHNKKAQNEGMEKNILYKLNLKETRTLCTSIRQDRLWTKDSNMNTYIKKKYISNKQIVLHFEEWEEETEQKVSRMREVARIRAEINAVETRKSVGKNSVKPRAHFLKR